VGIIDTRKINAIEDWRKAKNKRRKLLAKKQKLKIQEIRKQKQNLKVDQKLAVIRALTDQLVSLRHVPAKKLDIVLTPKKVKIYHGASEDFYHSPAWIQVRYRALTLYGAKCQCCGATRADGVIIHVDHIKPRSLYPHLALDLDNLQVLCSQHHDRRSVKI